MYSNNVKKSQKQNVFKKLFQWYKSEIKIEQKVSDKNTKESISLGFLTQILFPENYYKPENVMDASSLAPDWKQNILLKINSNFKCSHQIILFSEVPYFRSTIFRLCPQ